MRLISFICALFFLAAPTFAGDKEDIQSTISRQLEAFQLDDFAEAFSYASPSIQSIFGGPANFESMVKRGYPMVWKPGKVTFLSVDPYHHGMAQNIQIFDRNKKAHYLRYYMVKLGENWKVSGVEILPSSDFSV
ncbi:DUF4864 domain-containing protein [Rhodobacteraceae bacterium IMCC15231]|nr:DUF4864 domain-containing protein [Rhodobacteraceae bacterium IMCC15231]